MKYANKIGIKYPSKIRIVYQNSFPEPKNKVLLKEFNEFGFGSFFEGGRTMGYGIFIKPFFPKKSSIIRHEFAHVKQMEKMGIEAFLQEYLREAMTYNYLDMPQPF